VEERMDKSKEANMKLNALKYQMSENLDKILDRGANIDILVERTNSMRIGATSFRKKVGFMNIFSVIYSRRQKSGDNSFGPSGG
jgi:methyl coenzyme M reductase gamma subunit